MDRAWLQHKLQAYQTKSAQEEHARLAMLALLAAGGDCFSRSALEGHFTASAWVLDHCQERAALIHHRKLDKWLQPGGHADGEEDLPAVALREAQEETGLTNLCLLSSEIFDLDLHQIPPHGAIEAHWHYDVRFLLGVSECAPQAETLRQNAESRALAWCSSAQVPRLTQEESVLRMLGKWCAAKTANATQEFKPQRSIRDYQALVVEPLMALAASGGAQIKQIGESIVDGRRYPLLRVEVGTHEIGRESVLLAAGIHGDEPAGVLALRDFLLTQAQSYSSQYHFIAYPCINPYGFELDQRFAAGGVDLNRCFLRAQSGLGGQVCPERVQCAEVCAICADLEQLGYSFSFAIDLHEDNPVDPTDVSCAQAGQQPTAFYLYENCQHAALRMGKAIADSLRSAGYELCDLEQIWGDLNEAGVVRYGEASTNASFLGVSSFATYLGRSLTDLCLTFESYAASNLKLRIDIQLAAIRSALDVHKKSRLETYVGDGL